MALPELLPADCLLYSGNSLFDWLIYLKTWANVCHAEVYRGRGVSVASRNGVGVNSYPLRTEGLAYILRPKPIYGTFDIEAANAWFYAKAQGQAYGWWHLLSFLIPGWVDHRMDGQICSALATRYYRAGGFNPFAPDYDADRVAPGTYLQSPSFDAIWKAP